MELYINQEEDEARSLTVCVGCYDEKEVGLVLCWNCYKYRTDITPYKYFDGGLIEWLGKLKS